MAHLGDPFAHGPGLTCALLLASAPALAQEDASSAAPAIIVTAPPEPTARTVHRQARGITKQTNVYRSPMARLQRPVCPGINGLPVEPALTMVARIRLNAERVGLTVADPETCAPNVIVMFARDGRAQINRLAHTEHSLFAGLYRPQRRQLLASPGPVWAWSITSLRPLEQPGASRMYLNVRRDIELSMVVIDLEAARGMSLEQLADYATMRSLALTRPPPGETNPATILSLFEADGGFPRELTDFDIAYLRSVNSSHDGLRAASKLGKVISKYRDIAEEQKALDEGTPGVQPDSGD